MKPNGAHQINKFFKILFLSFVSVVDAVVYGVVVANTLNPPRG
jgi:hypothetical protein